jgi:hypothetical protein
VPENSGLRDEVEKLEDNVRKLTADLQGREQLTAHWQGRESRRERNGHDGVPHVPIHVYVWICSSIRHAPPEEIKFPKIKQLVMIWTIVCVCFFLKGFIPGK